MTKREQNRLIIFISVVIFFAAVFRFPCDDLRLSLVALFQGAVVITLAAFLWQYNKYWALFTVWAATSMYLNNFTPSYTKFGYITYSNIFSGCVLYAILVHWLTPKTAKHLMTAMCWVVFVNVAMLIMQAFNYDPIYTPKSGPGHTAPPVGIMTNPNEASDVIAFCFAAFLRPGWLITWIPIRIKRLKINFSIPFSSIIIPFLGLVLCYTSGGLVAVALGCIFYFFASGIYNRFSWKQLICCVLYVILASILYLTFIDAPGFAVRYWPWLKAIEFYKQVGIVGSGIGHWKLIFSKIHFGGVWYSMAHSEILQGWFEMGWPFVVIITAYIVNIIRRYKSFAIIPMTAFVIIFFMSLYHFPFHIGTSAMIGVVWLAILEVYLKGEQDGRRRKGKSHRHGLSCNRDSQGVGWSDFLVRSWGRIHEQWRKWRYRSSHLQRYPVN